MPPPKWSCGRSPSSLVSTDYALCLARTKTCLLYLKPETEKKGLEEVLVGSPGMARHVLPMLLDKLSSEVSTAKEAALKGLVAAVRTFAPPRAGAHLRAVGDAMFQEVRRGSNGSLYSSSLAATVFFFVFFCGDNNLRAVRQ